MNRFCNCNENKNLIRSFLNKFNFHLNTILTHCNFSLQFAPFHYSH